MLLYKKLIKSRELRIKILDILSWIPDEPMVRLQYRIHTGRRLHLKNPQRFTEKLQLYKLRYRNPLMLRCTDKYEVRRVVEEAGLGELLIPLIGVYDTVGDIDFSALPRQFVAKTTDGGGGNEVLICRDKAQLKEADFRATLDGWMRMPKRKPAGREWAYENGYPRRIVIEQLISDGKHTDLPDYKFFCFNGRVEMVYGISGRTLGNGAEFGFYDRDFKKLPIVRLDERPQTTPLPRPANYDKMIEIAEQLSKPFPHVRMDLYNVDGSIYFGEMTFYDSGGYIHFSPDSYDFTLGAYFDIDFAKNNAVALRYACRYKMKFVTLHKDFKTIKIMARPIAPTPTLKGKDAQAFMSAMRNVKKATLEERKKVEEGADRIKKMLTFTF